MEHSEELDPSLLWRATVERPRDTEAVRAHLELRHEASGDLVDPIRTAVIGHSYGGYTALAAAGARLESTRLTEICGTAQGSDDPILFLCDALVPHIDAMARATGFDSAPGGLAPGVAADSRVCAVRFDQAEQVFRAAWANADFELQRSAF